MKKFIFLTLLSIPIILFSIPLFASDREISNAIEDLNHTIKRQADEAKAQETLENIDEGIDRWIANRDEREGQFSQMTEGKAISDEIQGLREDVRQIRERQDEKEIKEEEALQAKRMQLLVAYNHGDRSDEVIAERERREIEATERYNKEIKEELPSIKVKYNLPMGSESDVVAMFINADSFLFGLTPKTPKGQLEEEVKKTIDQYEHPEKIDDLKVKSKWLFLESKILRGLLANGEISKDEYQARAKKLSEKWGVGPVISMDELFSLLMKKSKTKSKNETIDEALKLYCVNDISLNEYIEIKHKIIEAYKQKQASTEGNSGDNSDLMGKLKTLNKLLADGLITKDDFAQQKKKLLDSYTGRQN